MTNQIVKEVAERTSFYKLFKQSKLGVKIPIIQRDYAQGRPSQNEVRDGFLNALFSYLDEGKPNRDLDFVYGSISKGETDNFTPLDGQQRLTTLFLLHWYLALRSDNMDSFKQVMLHQNQSRFTYETRTSSKEFCDALITSEIDLDDLLDPDDDVDNSLSKTIKNNVWYFSSWDYDLTVQSMLVMLDAIHHKFNAYPYFYDRLIDLEEPVITFLFLNLQKFSLTDDLYLKMNARGKPLTDFENFKAKFEQYIEELDWEGKKYHLVLHEDLTREVSLKEYFAHNIDTKWGDFFWSYRNRKLNNFDAEIINFIRFVFTCQYALVNNVDKDPNLEFLLGSNIAKKRRDYTDSLTFSLFKKLNALSTDAILNLISDLDVLSGKQFGNVKYTFFEEKDIIVAVLNNEASAKQRILLYAYTAFLKRSKLDSSNLEDWMRVVYNLVENREFDTSSDFARGIKEVDKLISKSQDILGYLKTQSVHIGFFVGVQVLEEQIKAHLITKSSKWKESITKAERHTYFKGQIGFILEFSGIIDYFEIHRNCEWTQEEDAVFYEKFNQYTSKASAVFDFFNSQENKQYLLERALLCRGDYLVNTSSNRKNFLSTSKNMRDYSWKRLLRYNNAEYVDKRNYVKELFDDNFFEINDLRNTFTNIIENASASNPDLGWRKYFISTPRLLDYCSQGFICMDADQIMLYNASQRNHKHKEMRIHHYFLNHIENITTSPFERAYSSEEKGDFYNSRIIFSGYEFEEKQYQLEVSFKNGMAEVSFSNLEEIQFQYPSELATCLRDNDFQYSQNDNFNIWERTIALENLNDCLKTICSQLP
ncbi:MAG: DUF262 domain-containing protein [Saprospiraceae bacterium]|nr:DUF262 domain-containing protein [Saprospiraceae bacterium]